MDLALDNLQWLICHKTKPYKLFVLDKNTWYYIAVQTNDYKQVKKSIFEKKIE